MAKTIGSFDLASLKNLRDDVTQYFWFESDSSSAWGSGAHVTLYPESQFTDSTSPNYMKGQNIIMNTDGFSIRNGGLPMMVLDNNSLDFNVVDTSEETYVTTATFGNDGAQIGQDDESHLEIDYHSLRLVDKNNNTYFYASYVLDRDGNRTDEFLGNGLKDTFELSEKSIDTNYIVKVNEQEIITGITKYTTKIIFSTAPANNAIIKVIYTPYSTPHPYAYTFGVRRNNHVIGACSVAEGVDVVASGGMSHAEGDGTEASGKGSHAEGWGTSATEQYSHAEGWSSIASGQRSHAEGGPYGHDMGGGQIYLQETKASGTDSHAEGCGTTASGGNSHSEGAFTVASGRNAHAQNWGTIAQRKSQTTIGEFNVADTLGADENARGAYALIVGNGTADDARSNALTVDWDGNITINGHSSPIGTTETHIPSAVSCASGKYYQVAYLTLDPGTWIISGSARFQQSNTTGIRRVLFTNDTSNYDNVTTQPSSLGNIWYQTFNGSAFPASGAADVKTTSAPINVTTVNPTIRLIAYQSSGSAMNVTGRFYAIRIK